MKRAHFKILYTTKSGTLIGTRYDFREQSLEVLLLHKHWIQWNWYDQAHANDVLHADTPIWSRSFNSIIEYDIILKKEWQIAENCRTIQT
jgi:hypothetical protein